MMGKNSKKITKNLRTQKNDEDNKKMEISKNELEEIIARGDYEKGLEKVICLLEAGHTDAFILLATAKFYFQAGDYERAAQWIDNTLTVEPTNINARLLLANICLLEDRIDDGFKIYEFVLKHNLKQLSKQNCQDMRDKLEFYAQTERTKITTEYIALAEFLEIKAFEDNIEEKAIPEVCKTESIEADTEALIEKPYLNEFDVEKTKQEILQKKIDVKGKITLCNSFAGACFFEQKLDVAEDFLMMALSFNCKDKETLTNYIHLALEQKNQKKALQYAAELQETDFSLLAKIRNI
jgi:tetratricopeptide (TPR) repeat protein